MEFVRKKSCLFIIMYIQLSSSKRRGFPREYTSMTCIQKANLKTEINIYVFNSGGKHEYFTEFEDLEKSLDW